MRKRDNYYVFKDRKRRKSLLVPAVFIGSSLVVLGYMGVENNWWNTLYEKYKKINSKPKMAYVSPVLDSVKKSKNEPLYQEFELDIDPKNSGLEKILVFKGGDKLGNIKQVLPNQEEILAGNVYDLCSKLIADNRSYGPQKNVRDFLNYAISIGLPVKSPCENLNFVDCFINENYNYREQN